jgi:hypothetical protein
MTIVTPTGITGINSITSLVDDITFSTASGSSLTANGLSFTNLQTSSINNGPLAGFRNAIINGNFDVWQRGTSFTAADVYTTDRWFINRNSSTATLTRQSFTLGQTDVPGEPTYFCRTAVTSVTGAANIVVIEQRIEDVRTFAGQTVTVSFWAKADGSKPIAIELSQNFGTGGSPSTRITGISVTKVTLSTNWQKVTVTATLPSISGKTLGTDDNSHLALYIWFDAGSNFNARTDSLGQQSGTFDIAQVQLEPGTVATPFERRSFGQELALCQRYYISTLSGAPNELNLIGPAITVDRIAQSGIFPVAMRGVPTVTIYSPSGTAGKVALYNNLSVDLGSGFVANTPSQGGFRFVFNGSSLTGGNYYMFRYTADADL